MYLFADDFHKAYRTVKSNAHKSSQSTVLVFTAVDIDSLCAVQMLTTILKSDDILYQLEPLSGVQDLSSRANEILGIIVDEGNGVIPNPDSPICSIFMVNCGGTFDVTSYIPISSKTTVYIFDSHRPFDLGNIDQENRSIYICCSQESISQVLNIDKALLGTSDSDDDDYIRPKAIVKDQSLFKNHPLNMYISDSDMSDDEVSGVSNSNSDNDDDIEDSSTISHDLDSETSLVSSARQKRASFIPSKYAESHHLVSDTKRSKLNSNSSSNILKNRKKKQSAIVTAAKLDRRKRFRQLRNQVLEQQKLYYAYSHYGQSVSSTIYQLANQLGLTETSLSSFRNKTGKNDMSPIQFIWLSILGTTSIYLSEQITSKEYITQYQSLRKEVARISSLFSLAADVDQQEQNELLPDEDFETSQTSVTTSTTSIGESDDDFDSLMDEWDDFDPGSSNTDIHSLSNSKQSNKHLEKSFQPESHDSHYSRLQKAVSDALQKEDAQNFDTIPAPAPFFKAPAQVTSASGVEYVERNISKVTVHQEYRFFLYRFWNLYASVVYSPYLSCKFSVWESHQRVRNFFVRLGLPLNVVKNAYSSMPINWKVNLTKNLPEIIKTLRLDELTYPSFRKTAGVYTQLNASDVVYSLESLLSVPQSFHNALFVVAYDNITNLQPYIQQATNVQKSICEVIFRCISTRQIMFLEHFSYILIKEDPKVFCVRHLLYRFARCLRRAIYSLKPNRNFAAQNAKKNGLIVLSFNADTDTYLIVGIPPMKSFKNPYGTYFDSALKEGGIRSLVTDFDNSFIEIDKYDHSSFLESLETVLHGT